MKFVFSVLIFAVTLICIIIKPFKKKDYFYVLIFSIISILLNIVNFNDCIFVVNNIWNAVLSLISIMIISSILDEAGFFKWAAYTMVFSSEGKSRVLFVSTILLGMLISIFFNNDGTILILTPIVYEIVKGLSFDEKSMLPFLFACCFIADAGSMPLVVSNLANIVNADTLHISFNQYFKFMSIPAAAAIISAILVMVLYFKNKFPSTYKMSAIKNPDDYVTSWGTFNFGFMILVLTVVGYFVASSYNIPVSFVSMTGAFVFIIYCLLKKSVDVKKVLRKAPYDIIIFAFGMYLIVFGLYKNGFSQFSKGIISLCNMKSPIISASISGIFSTITACTMNNLPSVMINALSIKDVPLNLGTRAIVCFANVIGNDIGAKLTPIGALSTIMWMDILKSKGINITWRKYIKVSFIIIIPVLIISLIVLSAYI